MIKLNGEIRYLNVHCLIDCTCFSRTMETELVIPDDISEFVMTVLAKMNVADDTLDEQLIERVKARPILYCNNHLHFGHEKKTNNTWRGIGKALNLDGPTAKARWEALIDFFVEEYNSLYPPLGSNSRKKNEKKFKHFDKMFWMAHHIPQLDVPSPFTNDTKCINTKLEEPEEPNSETTRLPNSESRSDYFFMLSLMEELQSLSLKQKLKFKSDVFELLEKCCRFDKK